MIIQCEICKVYFDDEFRSTLCQHDAFLANDGENYFTVHHEAYLSPEPPQVSQSRESKINKFND